jgi:hypothetical protein
LPKFYILLTKVNCQITHYSFSKFPIQAKHTDFLHIPATEVDQSWREDFWRVRIGIAAWERKFIITIGKKSAGKVPAYKYPEKLPTNQLNEDGMPSGFAEYGSDIQRFPTVYVLFVDKCTYI